MIQTIDENGNAAVEPLTVVSYLWPLSDGADHGYITSERAHAYRDAMRFGPRPPKSKSETRVIREGEGLHTIVYVRPDAALGQEN